MSEDRFWARVDRSAGPDECWPWQGARIPQGYGQVVVDGRRVGAHRRAYQLVKGEIPDGLQLDHLCRNPPCVNPSHLEAVTGRENTLRGTGPSAASARQTHCVRGHELTSENTYLHGGVRHCRTCRAERRKAALEGEREANRLRACRRRATARRQAGL